MKKRKGIIWGVIGGFTLLVGSLVFRSVRVIRKMKGLREELYLFLTDVYGVEPKVSVNVAMNFKTRISIKVRFPEELLESSPDIEADILGYIEENFLDLVKHEIVVTILPLEEDEEEEIEDLVEELEDEDEE